MNMIRRVVEDRVGTVAIRGGEGGFGNKAWMSA